MPHHAWAAAAPLPLAHLYLALLEGDTTLQLPLPLLHPDKQLTLSRLVSMPTAASAAFTAPCQAYLSYMSPLLQDADTAMCERFVAIAAEALCVHVVLCETHPQEFLLMLGELLQQPSLGSMQLPPDWSHLKVKKSHIWMA